MLGRLKTDNVLLCSGISGMWGDVLHMRSTSAPKVSTQKVNKWAWPEEAYKI